MMEQLRRLRVLPEAHCESSSLKTVIRRADPSKLREIFNKYASHQAGEEMYMTYEDFVIRFLGLLPETSHDKWTLDLLAHVCDTNRTDRISFAEFQALEGLLCLPDATYAFAFAIFDSNGDGKITFKEFVDVMGHTEVYRKIPFDFEVSDFTLRHFGSQHKRNLTYDEFTQTLHDFFDEHAIQAFLNRDSQKRGFVTSANFREILLTLRPYLLTEFVKDNLVAVAMDEKGSNDVTYPFFTAFISLLNNMELVKKVFSIATGNNLNAELTKEEFMFEASKFTQLTPMEVDILFRLAALRHQTGKVNYADIVACSPINEERMPYHIRSQYLQETVQDVHAGKGRSAMVQILENMYRFTLGSIAGAVGATAVYPIDLVKTRLQNQRSTSYVGELMYKNSVDCFKKVVRFEGIRGLYRGLTPQLVGVAPEKAIKLTMNDLMRDKLRRADGTLPLWAECVAGGCGGASQVMFTNPLEIVKIRLQVAGEIAETRKVSAGSVIRELGIFGLYKGARACFLRDIPFSAIYFPAYAHNKQFFADDTGYNSLPSLLLSATLAGVPAAGLVTPADVIKTRLQVSARQGQTTYNGIFDCVRKILAEEGGRALWKGATARVFRSSPQFGVTLMTYEMLQRVFHIDFGGRTPEGSRIETPVQDALPVNPDHVGGYRLALATFEGIETKLGLRFPKFSSTAGSNQ